tara:strand:+ start:12435 stop:12761 length:327 start_codon:yes stop_codon:yes gene_type:complete
MAEDTRVMNAGPDAKAGVQLKKDEAALIGSKNNLVVANKHGVTIRGPMSILATSESIRKGGLFIGLNDFVETLPSCIVLPLPRNIQVPPVFMMANVAKDIAYFLAFLV